MTLPELTAFLAGQDQLTVRLPDGTPVPAHFHLTEVGEDTRRFRDCGGALHHERRASLQLWVAADTDHRLSPAKLRAILERAHRDFDLGDAEVAVDYQGARSIERFGLATEGNALRLVGRRTTCLQPTACLTPAQPARPAGGHCTPASGCC